MAMILHHLESELRWRQQACFRFFHRIEGLDDIESKKLGILANELNAIFVQSFSKASIQTKSIVPQQSVDILFPAIFPFTLFGRFCS